MLAKTGEIPKYISDRDWLIWRCLTYEIARYKRGEITAEELVLEHKQLGERHRRISADYGTIKEMDGIRIALGGMGLQAKESGCQVCRRIFDILDGLDHEKDNKM